MPNTRDITSENSNILIIGDSGTKKTRFLAGVPDIYVCDFDKGMASARDFAVEYDTFKDLGRGIKGSPFMEKQGLYEYGKAWDAYWAKMVKLNEDFNRGKGPKALGLDSLTHMSMIAVDKILKDTNQELPHQGTWGAHHQYFKEAFSMMTAWPCRIIATAHIERNTNDLTQDTEKLPLLAGKLAPLITTFFDEVYFAEVEGVGEKMRWVVRTVQTKILKQAKSRWAVPDGTETSWEAVSKFLPSTPGVVLEIATPAVPVAKPHTPASKEGVTINLNPK